jgi:hypothetical protein
MISNLMGPELHLVAPHIGKETRNQYSRFPVVHTPAGGRSPPSGNSKTHQILINAIRHNRRPTHRSRTAGKTASVGHRVRHAH